MYSDDDDDDEEEGDDDDEDDERGHDLHVPYNKIIRPKIHTVC